VNLQLDFRPTIARLRDNVAALNLVGGAAEYEQARVQLATVPAAFVIPGRDSAGPNDFGNQIVQQTVAVEFAIVLAVRNLSDSVGAAAHESLRPVRNAVAAALLNWAPDEDFDGLEYAAGELFDFANNVLWWAETYRTAHVIRSE
jgi:hypothetical protein